MVPLVVGILAFVGGFLLEFVRRRGADRRWLLEQRHDRYVTLIKAATDLLRQIQMLKEIPRPLPDDVRDPLNELDHGFGQAHLNMMLVGSEDAVDRSSEILTSFSEVRDRFGAHDDYEPAVAQVAKQLARLVIELRDELQPAPWWRPGRLGRVSARKVLDRVGGGTRAGGGEAG